METAVGYICKDATYMASDMTYDPTTGMIYGCFSNADASDYEFR